MTVDTKTISLVGKSLYAVVKGTDEYAGSEATSKEFVVSAAESKITNATVKIGTKDADVAIDKNTIAVSGNEVTINSTGSDSGVKTNSPLTFSVDQDGDGDAFTTMQYTIDLSKIARV